MLRTQSPRSNSPTTANESSACPDATTDTSCSSCAFTYFRQSLKAYHQDNRPPRGVSPPCWWGPLISRLKVAVPPTVPHDFPASRQFPMPPHDLRQVLAVRGRKFPPAEANPPWVAGRVFSPRTTRDPDYVNKSPPYALGSLFKCGITGYIIGYNRNVRG